MKEFGFESRKIGRGSRSSFDRESGVLTPRGVVVVQVGVEAGGRKAWVEVGFNVSPLVEGTCLVFGRGFEGQGGMKVRRVGRG